MMLGSAATATMTSSTMEHRQALRQRRSPKDCAGCSYAVHSVPGKLTCFSGSHGRNLVRLRLCPRFAKQWRLLASGALLARSWEAIRNDPP